MRRKNMWAGRLTAILLCTVLSAEPIAIYAEDFSDGTANTEMQDKTEIPESTESYQNAESQVDADPESLSDEFESPEQDFESEEDAFSSGIPDTQSEDAPSAGAVRNGTCGKNVTWALQNGVLTVEGNGAMDDFYRIVDWETGEPVNSHLCPWEDYADEIVEADIKDGVTSIGDIAFVNCNNLRKVVIGNSVKRIGEKAFANDYSLTDITIGNSLENIEDDALYGCGIKKLVLPASLKEISPFGLVSLWELEEIDIPDNGVFKSIDGALYIDQGKTLLLYPPKRTGEYVIPDGVTAIGGNAFSSTHLTKVVIPGTVKEIGMCAFSYSNYLTTIIFGNGITEIPSMCCFYCKALTSVTLPEGLKTIEYSAFDSCTSLKSITVPSTVTNLGQDAFDNGTKVTFLNPSFSRLEDGSYINGINVNVEAKEMYAKAFQVLDLVNKERAKQGLSPLTMDSSLLDTAMQRGFENVLYWSHTRPSGQDCFSANSLMMGENIAMGPDAAGQVMNLWMNSEGHRNNILSARFRSIGIGCVCYQGIYYWVQCFGEQLSSTADSTSYTDKTNSRNVLVNYTPKYYKASLQVSKTSLQKGQTGEVNIFWDDLPLKGSGAVIESSDPSVCTVKDGIITAVGKGKADIRMYFEGHPETTLTKTIQVTKPATVQKKVKVTFNANGGSVNIKSKNITVKSKIGKLPIPRRKGYVFTGWYTAKTKGKKVISSIKITKKQTLYAHWKRA